MFSFARRPTLRAAFTEERTNRAQELTTTAVCPGTAHLPPQTAAKVSAQGIKLVPTAEALLALLEDQIPFAKEKVCLLDEYLRAYSFVQHVCLFIYLV